VVYRGGLESQVSLFHELAYERTQTTRGDTTRPKTAQKCQWIANAKNRARWLTHTNSPPLHGRMVPKIDHVTINRIPVNALPIFCMVSHTLRGLP